MKKIFQSAIVSLVLTAIMFSMIQVAFAAYPGPDDPPNAIQTGSGGTKCESRIHAEYGGPGWYNRGAWYSARTLGSATPASGMYVWWKLDGQSMEDDITDQNVVLVNWPIVAYDYISARCRAQFQFPTGTYFFLDSGTCRADVA
jgi:hypothetical protein